MRKLQLDEMVCRDHPFPGSVKEPSCWSLVGLGGTRLKSSPITGSAQKRKSNGSCPPLPLIAHPPLELIARLINRVPPPPSTGMACACCYRSRALSLEGKRPEATHRLEVRLLIPALAPQLFLRQPIAAPGRLGKTNHRVPAAAASLHLARHFKASPS